MKKIFTLAAFLWLLSSCQKELSYEDPNNPPGSAGTQLYRMGIKSGNDSVTLDFGYNTAGRIITYKLIGTAGGQSVDEVISFTRNNANIITRSTYKSSSLPAGITEVATDHFYDEAKGTYKYSITKLEVPTLGTFTDSLIYEYDGSKRLTRIVDYINDGSGYTEFAKEEYSYTGNNVGQAKYFSWDDQAQTYTVDITETYEYDDKTNPLLFKDDAVILKIIANLALFYSANNYTKRTSDDGAAASVITRTFTYNNKNRPATAVSTADGNTSTITYYYQ